MHAAQGSCYVNPLPRWTGEGKLNERLIGWDKGREIVYQTRVWQWEVKVKILPSIPSLLDWTSEFSTSSPLWSPCHKLLQRGSLPGITSPASKHTVARGAPPLTPLLPWCLQSDFFHIFNICVYIHMYISCTYSQFSLWCSVVSVFFFSLITLVVLEMLMGCCWRPQLWPAAGSSWLALALSDMGKLLAASHRHPCILCHYQNLAMQTQHIGSGSSDAELGIQVHL